MEGAVDGARCTTSRTGRTNRTPVRRPSANHRREPRSTLGPRWWDDGQNRIAEKVNGGVDDRTDAAHHCLWQLHLTVFAGAGFAEKVGDGHETVAGTDASHAMDFHNNEVARSLADDDRITAARSRNNGYGRPGSAAILQRQALERAVFDVCTTAVHAAYQAGVGGLVSVDHTEHADGTTATDPIEGHLIYLQG